MQNLLNNDNANDVCKIATRVFASSLFATVDSWSEQPESVNLLFLITDFYC